MCVTLRRTLYVALLCAVVGLPATGVVAATTNTMAPFDAEVQTYMEARAIPGGALAVVKEGRLVYARGYGWADRENHVPATSASLFRIGSISKPITAVAIMKLIEGKRLRLDACVLEVLNLPAAGTSDTVADPRFNRVTIDQLLHHTGGWDRGRSFDPMFRSVIIAKKTGVPSPPGPDRIVRYMLGQPLSFDPGTREAYSNFGYCLLGRVIEKVTGQRYEDYVKDAVLSPAGITRMRIGASLKSRRADGEVCYYTTKNDKGQNVFGDATERVPVQYGSFCVEDFDAHGGWIASAVDLARFAAALDNRDHSPLLKPETFDIMYARPLAPVGSKPDGSPADVYYACGWSVRPVGKDGKANYWHAGGIPGTYALLVRRWDGLSWAVLFNLRSEDAKLPAGAIDAALHRAADAVTSWPSVDLLKNATKGEQ